MPKKKHPWYRQRSYLHFDSPVNFQSAQRLVTSPKRVAKHSFYPFIDYQIETEKLNKDPKSGKLTLKPKSRPIAYAAHLDSHIYSYYTWKLGRVYEQKLEQAGIGDCVLAFRSLGKSNIDFAASAFQEIKERGVCSAVALDIKGFFDHLDHQELKRAWEKLLHIDKLPFDQYAIFKSLTKYSTVVKNELYQVLGISINNPRKNGRYRLCDPHDFREKVRKAGLIKPNKYSFGIPQGSTLSPLLSNIYMLEFDTRVYKYVTKIGGVYFRYCDDMLLIVPPVQLDSCREFVTSTIKDFKLEVNGDKTEIRNFKIENGIQTCEKPLQYLGFTFDGQRILIRSAALARYSQNMKRGVKLAKSTRDKRNRARVARGEKEKPLFRKKLYKRYSHLGSNNFLRYGYRAAKIMQSEAIKKQLKPLWERLVEEIKK